MGSACAHVESILVAAVLFLNFHWVVRRSQASAG
jgi:hypothetical protein